MSPASGTSRHAADRAEILLEFDDNALLPPLFGPRDQHLESAERRLGVTLVPRGNLLTISGTPVAVERARAVLTTLYDRQKRGAEIEPADFETALRLVENRADHDTAAPVIAEPAIRTRKRQISPRTQGQADYVRALRDHTLTFGIGPAGTGKTYLAVACAVDMLMTGKVTRIILSRPAVEAGERLGFLPGDMKEKVDPYLRPLYDALHDMLPHDQVLKRLTNGDIEVAPLAFMRGRTLPHSFIILDEAQNTTPGQMKMFLTRMGEDSVMAITGDLSQIDLPPGAKSGLTDAIETLGDIPDIAIVRLTDVDVVRHPLVRQIVRAYEARDKK